MEHNEGAVVDEEDDYYFDDPRRTAGELIWRSRSSFPESDSAKVVSILTARENTLKEEVGSWKRANQRLKNLELGKRKADSEVKKWRTMYCLVESRISKLEAEAKELKSGEPIVRVSGENAAGETEILDMDEIKAKNGSNAKINLPNKAGALRLYREEIAKKQAANKSKEDAPVVPEHVYTSSPKPSPLRKRQRKDYVVDHGKKVESSSKMKSVATTLEPDSSMMLLSSGISSFKEPTGFLDRSNEFLLSADEEFSKGKKTDDVFNMGILSTFQALQAQLHLHDRYKVVSEKCAKFQKSNDVLKVVNGKLDKEMKELEQKNLALEEELKGVKEERDRHSEESTKASAVVAEKESLVESLKEQLMSIASEAICKTRAKILREYLSGEHVKWDRVEMQEVVDIVDEMVRLEGSSPGEVDEEVYAEQNEENLDNAGDSNAIVADPPLN